MDIDLNEVILDCDALILGFFEIQSSSPRAFGRVISLGDGSYKVEIVRDDKIRTMRKNIVDALRWPEMSKVRLFLHNYVFNDTRRHKTFCEIGILTFRLVDGKAVPL
jgi:hypothetical protein